MLVFKDNKVSTFWNDDRILQKNAEADSTSQVETISKIFLLKQKCLSKVENNEWTIEDYNYFISFVKKIRIEKFLNFYDLVILYMDLSNEDCREEITNLNKLDFINPTVKTNSFYELMASSIYSFQEEILRLSRTRITSQENNRLLDIEEEISMYEDIINQLHNPESDYTKILKEIFRKFIEKSVTNQELKEKISNMEYIIINCKIKNILYSLVMANQRLESKKYRVANDQYRDSVRKA